MKKQGIVTLSVTIILLAVLLYLALFGVCLLYTSGNPVFFLGGRHP